MFASLEKSFVSRHIQFNPEEYPFPRLFSIPPCQSQLVSNSHSTMFLQSLPSFSFSSSALEAAQPSIPTLSPYTFVDSYLAHSLPTNTDQHRIPSKLSKHKAAPAPSVHPMVTKSKSKQLLVTSPHALVSSLEPNYDHEAILDSNWVKAMEEEFSALQHNHTWKLIPISSYMNLIDCKSMFRVKYNSDGSILKHKARLVTKVSSKLLGLTMLKHLVLLSRFLLFGFCFPWLLPLAGIFSKLMSTMFFLMVI